MTGYLVYPIYEIFKSSYQTKYNYHFAIFNSEYFLLFTLCLMTISCYAQQVIAD